MKKTYLIVTISIIFLLVLTALYFVNIPSPSKLISEDYILEIK